jgi:hypothetical protein
MLLLYGCYAEPQVSSVAGVAVRNVKIVDHPTTNLTSELLLDVTNHSDSPLLCAADSALVIFRPTGPHHQFIFRVTDSLIGWALRPM